MFTKRHALALLAAPALLLAAASANASPLSGLTQSDLTAKSNALIKVHGVHPSCMMGPVSPTGTGPSKYHRTPEAGVHILCKRPPSASGDLTIKPRAPSRLGAGKLRLR